jgi:uncharacterized membrane protein (DUF2068 family)
MSNSRVPVWKGRNIGIVALTAVQLLVGFVHAGFWFWLLAYSSLETSAGVYSLYTVAFGVLTLIFAVGLWMEKPWGWVGTVAVALFVIAADSLTLLNLPSVPGIPTLAGAGEIPYSIIVVGYLMQTHIRKKYKIN